jgi:hypothetical protein
MRAATALAALAVISCEEVEYCELCAGEDPRRPLPAENVGKIWRGDSERRLPVGARNVFFHERCGMDCTWHVRFDLPIAEARAFARSLPLEHPLTPGANPWGANPWGVGSPVWEGVLALGWWPRRFPANVEGGENMTANGHPAYQIAIVPRGSEATVWIRTFDT